MRTSFKIRVAHIRTKVLDMRYKFYIRSAYLRVIRNPLATQQLPTVCKKRTTHWKKKFWQ